MRFILVEAKRKAFCKNDDTSTASQGARPWQGKEMGDDESKDELSPSLR